MNNLKNELIEKNNHLYNNQSEILKYFLKTKENFVYRYLETSSEQSINISQLAPNLFEATSHEDNLGHALKMSDPEIKKHVKLLAKNTAKELKPKVKLNLKSYLKNMAPNNGEIIFTGSVNCHFPDFDEQYAVKKEIIFHYQDIMDFRKNLALKLEEVCSIFI